MARFDLEYATLAVSAAVSHAQDVRAGYRKRVGKGDRRRAQDIQLALNRLKRVMAPIRREVARIPYAISELDDPAAQQELLDRKTALLALSQDIQRERRKLWKMQTKKQRERKRTYGRTRR